MAVFSQNFVEALMGSGRICPGEFDFDELFTVLSERKRFSKTVELTDKIRSFISRRAASDLLTHHYFIHSASLNDGLAAITAIYGAIIEKYNYSIGDYIIDKTDIRNTMGNADEYDVDCPSLFIMHRDVDEQSIYDYDINGIKICFVIYSDDVLEEDEKSCHIMAVGANPFQRNAPFPNADQAALSLHYTYIDIPADNPKTLAEYINDFFVRNGFITDGVKKQIKMLAELPSIKDEYAAIAAAKSVLNTHVRYFNEMPKLMPQIFSEYLGIAAAKSVSTKKEIGDKECIIGLEKEKEELNSCVNGLILDIERHKAGLGSAPLGCNMVFAGSPGTVKTTLARIFARTLAENRIIPSANNFKECRKSDIIGQYVGHTAKQVDTLFEEMDKKGGGVIFFDEIYTISENDSTCYDKEAVNCITQNIENYRSSVYCIFAGYKNKMENFIKSNPGLSSRISSTIIFEDYSSETLCKIFDSMVKMSPMLFRGNTANI